MTAASTMAPSATIEIHVGLSEIMTFHRPALTVTVDGVKLTDHALASFAGLDYYADYQARMSPDRALPVLVGGHSRDLLCFRGGFDAMVAWAADRGVGDGGWARHKHRVWLPVGDPRLKGAAAQRPCATFGCEFARTDPAAADDAPGGLCKRHTAAAARAAANDARRSAESAARQERWAEQDRARRAARDWADRLRDEFGIDAAVAADGRVGVSGEGLHGLLTIIAAEMPWLLDDDLPHELRHSDQPEAGQ